MPRIFYDTVTYIFNLATSFLNFMQIASMHYAYTYDILGQYIKNVTLFAQS